jgi:hypothetical protein
LVADGVNLLNPGNAHGAWPFVCMIAAGEGVNGPLGIRWLF